MNFITIEFAMGGGSFPPLLIAGILCLPPAILTVMLLKQRLGRFFHNAPLILIATCVLGLGLGGPVSAFDDSRLKSPKDASLGDFTSIGSTGLLHPMGESGQSGRRLETYAMSRCYNL
jgi:hypothetical protein